MIALPHALFFSPRRSSQNWSIHVSLITLLRWKQQQQQQQNTYHHHSVHVPLALICSLCWCKWKLQNANIQSMAAKRRWKGRKLYAMQFFFSVWFDVAAVYHHTTTTTNLNMVDNQFHRYAHVSPHGNVSHVSQWKLHCLFDMQ